MKVYPPEIVITYYHRRIAILMSDGTERLGFFHKWTERDGKDYALIENTEGTFEYVTVEAIRILPIDNEVPSKELEEAYREINILKG